MCVFIYLSIQNTVISGWIFAKIKIANIIIACNFYNSIISEMKKLINLIALVILVSLNALTPFSYAGADVYEDIPENMVENFWELLPRNEDNLQKFSWESQKNELENEVAEVQEPQTEDGTIDEEQDSLQWENEDDVNIETEDIDWQYSHQNWKKFTNLLELQKGLSNYLENIQGIKEESEINVNALYNCTVTFYPNWWVLCTNGASLNYCDSNSCCSNSGTTLLFFRWLVEDPGDPTYTWLTFAWWYEDSKFHGNRYEFWKYEGNRSFNLYAKWDWWYSITFESNEGTDIVTQFVVGGNEWTQPIDPVKEWFQFLWWYSDEEMNTEFDFNTPINESITLYAKWKQDPTVTYDSNWLWIQPNPETVKYGTMIKLPNVIMEWYKFLWWYTAPEWWEFVWWYNSWYTVVDDVVLYAQWERNPTVMFDANWWSSTSTVIAVEKNTQIQLPNASRDGYTFLWWYTALEWWAFVWWYNSGYTVIEDIVLYAQWEKNPTVTFDANWWSSTPTAITVERNAQIQLPNVTMEWYTFLWWYTEVEWWTRVWWYNSGYTVTEDITLYAHWDKWPIVTYDANGWNANQSSNTAQTNTSVQLPYAWRDGYKFLWWYTDAEWWERVWWYYSYYTVTENITLYAHWEKLFTVTFDRNSGNWVYNTHFAVLNESISLPDGYGRDYHYSFSWWYTELTWWSRIWWWGDSYIVTKDITLYAHWEPAPKVRFLDGDEVIVNEEMYLYMYWYVDYWHLARNLTWYDMSQNSDFEEYLSEKEWQIFVWWYKDKNLIQKFDFENTTIEWDLDLYAKWESCPSGYWVVNNKCISDDAWVHYEDGYVEIKNGDKAVYIKDRNQWAEKSVIETKYGKMQELQNEYNNCYQCPDDRWAKSTNKNRWNNLNPDGCRSEQEIFAEMSDLLWESINDNYAFCHVNYNQNDDESFPLSFWDYYYRWNNTWASRYELWVDASNPRSMRANVSLLAIDRWFDGWHLWEPEWKWWIEWNTQANPCNAEDWEYLPTVDDWKKAMEIWYETKGYDLNVQDYDDDWYNYWDIYYDPEFMNDILVPNAGYTTYHSTEEFNHSNKRNIDLLALLFANPVMAEYQGNTENIKYIQNGYPYLWSAVDSGHKFWSFDERDNRYNYRNVDINEYDFDINAKAAPVRCFIDSDYVNSIVKYTVTFDTKWWNEIVPAQTVKEWKKLEEPSIPTRDWYTFDGWYTSNWTKWDFDTDTVQWEMTLYAKWRLCGEWFIVEDNKCIPLNYEFEMNLNWVIKVTDGSGIMYVRDRNVGVSDAAVIYQKLMSIKNSWGDECENSIDYRVCMKNKYLTGIAEINNVLKAQFDSVYDAEKIIMDAVLDEMETDWILIGKQMQAFRLMIASDYYSWDSCISSEDNEKCIDEYMLDYINETFTIDPKYEDIDDARDYVDNYLWYNWRNDNYYNLLNNQANWNYYYRWNNSWVNYNDLKFEDQSDDYRITNTWDLIKKWFTEWKIWVEWQWWIDWNPNPCDSEKWEYLPTPEDWKNLMEIWWNSRWYHMESANNQWINVIRISDDDWNNMQDEFESNMLIPRAWDIAWERFVNGTALWSAQNEGNNLGYYNNWLFYYGNKSISEEIWWNTYAMPVRCFVNPAEIPAVYVVSYETNGWNEINEVNVIAWDTVSLPTPSKANYTFAWWYTDKALTHEFTSSIPVTSDLTLYAKWTQNQSGGHSSWWGGWGSSNKIETPKEDNKSNVDNWSTVDNWEKDSEKTEDKNEWDNWGSSNDFEVVNTYNNKYTPELNQAYQFAYKNNITTKNTIEKADMSGKLTRIAMAKMLSQYAINVLWKVPDLSRSAKFKDVSSKRDAAYDNWVTLAYQLWIMWINMKDGKFRPDDEVTRWEFVTALSRLLYSTSDGEFKSTSKYYIHHMEKLVSEWIITNDDPKMKERRWYVMIMLMRSVK